MNIIQINSSARREGSHSVRLAAEFVQRLRADDPNATLGLRDLSLTPHRVHDDQCVDPSAGMCLVVRASIRASIRSVALGSARNNGTLHLRTIGD